MGSSRARLIVCLKWNFTSRTSPHADYLPLRPASDRGGSTHQEDLSQRGGRLGAALLEDGPQQGHVERVTRRLQLVVDGVLEQGAEVIGVGRQQLPAQHGAVCSTGFIKGLKVLLTDIKVLLLLPFRYLVAEANLWRDIPSGRYTLKSKYTS